MKIDGIFEHIGQFGRYHQLLYVVVFVAGLPNAFIILHAVFSHYEPDFHCELPSELTNLTSNNTIEYVEILNYSIPIKKDSKGDFVRDQCRMYTRNYSVITDFDDIKLNDSIRPQTVSCVNGWSFQLEKHQKSVVTEFGLVCEYKWKAALAVSIFQAGMALGSFSGTLADRYGRRIVFLWASFLQVVFTIFGALSWNYVSYAISMFLAGSACLINYVIAFVLVSEVIAVKWRNFIAISPFYSFSIGYCMEPLIAYLFQDWRAFLWAITALSTICYLPCFWLFPESARWLIIKGRKKEGIAELKKMAKMNKIDFDVDSFVTDKLLEEEAGTKVESTSVTETLRILFRSKITGRCVVVWYAWFVTGMSYYGISMFSTSFSDNRFLNCLFAGVAELPALVFGFFLIKWIGRPRSGWMLLSICGITNSVLPFVPDDVSILTTILAMIGKGAITAAFYLAYFLAAETVPTLQRSSVICIASVSARIGAFTSPPLALIGEHYEFVPNLVMGSLAILSGILLLLFVPETKDVVLPDTIEEAADNKRFYGLRIFRSFSSSEQDRKFRAGEEKLENNTL